MLSSESVGPWHHVFLSKLEIGAQTVKNVDNLLGSGVTFVQFPVFDGIM